LVQYSIVFEDGMDANSYFVSITVFFASTFCRKLQVKNAECCTMHFP